MRLVLAIDKEYAPGGTVFVFDREGMWDLWEWSKDYESELKEPPGTVMWPGYAPYYGVPRTVWEEFKRRVKAHR